MVEYILLINKKNKAYQKRKKDPEKYKKLKQIVQKELRTEYWKYIEKMICDIPINEPGQYETSKSKQKTSVQLYQKHTI